jgi:hypothetical protein
LSLHVQNEADWLIINDNKYLSIHVHFCLQEYILHFQSWSSSEPTSMDPPSSAQRRTKRKTSATPTDVTEEDISYTMPGFDLLVREMSSMRAANEMLVDANSVLSLEVQQLKSALRKERGDRMRVV